MQPLVIIVGPTGVGKSALGVSLAKRVKGEIISGDSVQIYRKLNIGSAKPTVEEQEGIPHHLIDELDPAEPFTAAEFQRRAFKLIEDIRDRGRMPIVVGGTGLYIRALLDPYSFAESGSEEIRAKWTTFLQDKGKESLHKELAKRDPLRAQRLHPNDTVRIIRALEIYELTGQPFSSQQQLEHKKYAPLDPSIIYVGLTAPRELIYERINRRCDLMLRQGLLEETLKLLQEGYYYKLKPLQSIGYRHAISYLRGFVTYTEMERLFKRDTRHFAKRQLTWFRRDPRITWYDITQYPAQAIIEDVIHTCAHKQSRVE